MPILEDDKNELLRQYLAKKAGGELAPAPYYQDPDASFAASEAANRRELTGQLGTSLQQLIHGISGSNQPLDNSINQGIIASANEPIAKDAANQKSIRDYLEKKYEMGLKKQSLDKENKMLEETLRHNRAEESMAGTKLGLEAKKMANQIPDQVKPAADELSKSVVSKVSIAQQIDAAVDKMESVTDDQKLQIGRELLKVLNSTEGKDAVGAEEVKRLGSKLEFAYGNFTNSNPTQFGRDISGFITDARNKSAIVKDASRRSKETYKSITGKEFPIEIPQDPLSEEEKSIARKKRIAELEALQSGVKK